MVAFEAKKQLQPPLNREPGVGSRGAVGFAVALVPEEPAGKILTTSAGAACVEATLSCRPGDEPPTAPRLPEPPPGAVFYPGWEGDPTSSTCRFYSEVRALRAAALAAALEDILRAVTTHAALADAVLEARAVRFVEPVVYPAPLVERLALDLLEAGLPVSFGPSWYPVLEGGLAVGSGGSGGEIEGFLSDHPAWRAAASSCESGLANGHFAGALDQRRASG